MKKNRRKKLVSSFRQFHFKISLLPSSVTNSFALWLLIFVFFLFLISLIYHPSSLSLSTTTTLHQTLMNPASAHHSSLISFPSLPFTLVSSPPFTLISSPPFTASSPLESVWALTTPPVCFVASPNPVVTPLTVSLSPEPSVPTYFVVPPSPPGGKGWLANGNFPFRPKKTKGLIKLMKVHAFKKKKKAHSNHRVKKKKKKINEPYFPLYPTPLSPPPPLCPPHQPWHWTPRLLPPPPAFAVLWEDFALRFWLDHFTPPALSLDVSYCFILQLHYIVYGVYFWLCACLYVIMLCVVLCMLYVV